MNLAPHPRRPRLQDVADLGEKLHVGRRLRLLVLLSLDEPVHGLHRKEQHPGDDQEIEGDGDEMAAAEHRALLLRAAIGEALLNRIGKRRVMIREVEPAGDRTDDRHEDVADERVDDLPERGSDDHADGKIDDIATQGELLEFLEHDGRLPIAESARC
jgi:hypothetical protein